MEKVLKVQNLKKIYKNGRGISDINLCIDQGEVLGLLGPNGSGKTTIMKSVTGLVRIDNGVIEVCGINLSDNFEEAIRNIGCLIENPSVIGNMTCYENLKLISRFYKNISPERIDTVLKMTGLTKYKDDKVKNFSLGMKQRLAISMAIYQNPKLVILDEPANGLDIEAAKELRRIISDLASEFMISFLISSHQIHEIEMLCNRVMIIREGKILDDCDIKSVKEKGIVLEDYFIERINS
ncbi:MAG: ABC transporter ATP-binding protein [Bacillota bacterium]|nr:ABC transporter ATP-binding protein [Bacillota bacterium]